MVNFNSPQKVFIKSKNNVKKILNNYNISLIIFSLLAIISNLLIHNNELVLLFIKNLITSLFITIIISYIFNIIKKEYSIKKLYTEDNTIFIAIVLSLFSINTNIYISILAIFTTILIKNIFKKINTSSVLYGILIIIVYKYLTNNINVELILTNKDNIIKYLFDIKYLCPIISIVGFIYLFYHKSIKYLLTFITIMLGYGIINNFDLYFPINELLNSSVIFLAIYTLTDYKVTPTINEGNIIYGIILGIISAILRFIIPSIAIIITLILGPLLTNKIDKISPKLKYNNKKNEYDEINRKYGNSQPWKLFNEIFDLMPLCAVIDKNIFCVHGGLSPLITTVDQIRLINRKGEIPHEGVICDLLWSDPTDENETWVFNSRGCGWMFGYKVVNEFNQINGVELICRAHQLAGEGIKYWFKEKNLVTIWSCPNYCYRCGNKAGIIKLDKNKQRTSITFDSVPKSKESATIKTLVPYFL